MNGVARTYNNGMNDGQSWYLSRNVGVYTATYDARATSILQNASSSEKDKTQATIYMQNRIKDIYNQDLALQQVISKAHQQTKDDLLLISGRDATGQWLVIIIVTIHVRSNIVVRFVMIACHLMIITLCSHR